MKISEIYNKIFTDKSNFFRINFCFCLNHHYLKQFQGVEITVKIGKQKICSQDQPSPHTHTKISTTLTITILPFTQNDQLPTSSSSHILLFSFPFPLIKIKRQTHRCTMLNGFLDYMVTKIPHFDFTEELLYI